MKIWFTSDQHFGHEKVIEFCKRPDQTVGEMNTFLIQRYNSRVGHEDLVYHLGDVCFLKPQLGIPLIKRLNGKRILIKGNHDKWSDPQYYEAGFSAVLTEAKLTLFGLDLKLSHYPYAPSIEEQRDMEPYDLRYLERRPTPDGSILLCGHVHEKWHLKDRMINVGVDVNDYAPVSIAQLQSLVSQLRS